MSTPLSIVGNIPSSIHQEGFRGVTRDRRLMHQPVGLLEIIHKSLAIQSHQELFRWMHGGVQELVPHDVLIAAWGDFVSGQILLDVVSPLPNLRTTEVSTELVLPFLADTFESWEETGCVPISFAVREGVFRFDGAGAATNPAANSLARMRWAIVHGIKDKRGDLECLYVFLKDAPVLEPFEVNWVKLLLPFVDVAFRRVSHLPMQRLASMPSTGTMPENQEVAETQATGRLQKLEDLSSREQEIMHWVSLGKTNPEIGHILCISPITVRNHLYRIFRKLDAMNRAQAVFQLRQRGLADEGN
ncbi:XrtB/PEP-CTERM-associated transcriptional regulator EpsA [Ferribacterium limneticum]|uniref:XrtB/PEP-CTERM-associated transcriptional regulator EpsA n=1 Tax=Ferribacterium limneticum TaxID=76259 RepID=UPI001CF99ABE|nr:XrtB/PEP-CTERM-associated transcriptional regulator EpsA [Ferribacterium limneticum]UCV27997.1 hypothetical protein KI617_17415 [Ferribacterium limneticum]UCV31914.1 hypothetical protein KI608_17415 [Ferribacterium limneticum]